MKLRQGFITYAADGEQIMVAAGEAAEHFHGMVRSNRTAAFIIDTLTRDVTEEELVSAMADKFDAPRDVISADVKRILDALRGIGALDE